MTQPDHRYSYWIAIDTPDFGAPERRLDVKVLDTEADPNTIRVDARGIEEISIFLNDNIVDLDREVRLVLNGEEKRLGVVERVFDQLFAMEPMVRKNMNFGWLYPTLVPGVLLPPPPAAPPATEEPGTPVDDTGPKGDPATESEAQKWFEKAEEAEKAGNLPMARAYYGKVVDLGETSYLARAKAKLAELEDK